MAADVWRPDLSATISAILGFPPGDEPPPQQLHGRLVELVSKPPPCHGCYRMRGVPLDIRVYVADIDGMVFIYAYADGDLRHIALHDMVSTDAIAAARREWRATGAAGPSPGGFFVEAPADAPGWRWIFIASPDACDRLLRRIFRCDFERDVVAVDAGLPVDAGGWVCPPGLEHVMRALRAAYASARTFDQRRDLDAWRASVNALFMSAPAEHFR